MQQINSESKTISILICLYKNNKLCNKTDWNTQVENLLNNNNYY